ncbi:hypothetical protein DID88_001309 [Monilinia fructigena]|uniref:Uncharacterized protein n=1 Tax=Monilinia fructigena TaxID=38457 RepID=A0A395J0K0_9HELO|nr:hypothetical protein DID88_001309 [Monilinia fructigena]
MRSLDPLQQQQQQQQTTTAAAGRTASNEFTFTTSSCSNGGPYYQNQLPHPSHQHQYPSVTSDPSMRYALPVDARVMSGGRHKKEIKRRTKTGCFDMQKAKNKVRRTTSCLPQLPKQPGPTAIQPAPSSAPSQASSIATANPYGNQPQMLQSGYGVPATMAYDPALTTPSAGQHYDYTSAIDPNLEASAPIPVINPFHSTPPAFGNPPAPVGQQASDVSQSPSTLEEAKHLYYSIYSPGLESFLESKWFSAKGAAKLMMTTHTASVEAKAVWALACMVKLGAEDDKKPRQNPRVCYLLMMMQSRASRRLTVFECLLTGRVAESNELTAPVQGSGDHHKLREFEFWYSLANFVCLREDDPNCAKDVDDTPRP